jgi:Protein of unknown function (DUF1566)
MRKTSLTFVAVCATLLWAAAAVYAAPPNPPPAGTRFPATGQITSYVAGDDGYYQAGSPLNYTDNGDGTITDNNTKLMWEEKDDVSGSLNRFTNTYPWAGTCQDNSTVCGTDADCTAVSGTAKCTPARGAQYTIFQWVAALNAEAFAGHTDWRIPNIKELQSIVDYGTSDPAVDAAFNTSCSSGCTVLTCSCTQSGGYWSATTFAGNSLGAWYVGFDGGPVRLGNMAAHYYVRAVRGGL